MLAILIAFAFGTINLKSTTWKELIAQKKTYGQNDDYSKNQFETIRKINICALVTVYLYMLRSCQTAYVLYKSNKANYEPLIDGNCQSLLQKKAYDDLIRFVLDISF